MVTGCYAQLNPELLSSMPDVDAVVGTNERHRIVPLVQMLLGRGGGEAVTAVHDARNADAFEEIPLYPSAVEHTRADLKIQEGCNNFCSYCIIPYTRGALKSRQPDAIIRKHSGWWMQGSGTGPDRYPPRRLWQRAAGSSRTGADTETAPGRNGCTADPSRLAGITGSR